FLHYRDHQGVSLVMNRFRPFQIAPDRHTFDMHAVAQERHINPFFGDLYRLLDAYPARFDPAFGDMRLFDHHRDHGDDLAVSTAVKRYRPRIEFAQAQRQEIAAILAPPQHVDRGLHALALIEADQHLRAGFVQG